MGNNDQKSKKMLLVVSCIVIAVLVGIVVMFSVLSNNKGISIRKNGIAAVEPGDMTAIFSSSATVASGNQGFFDILDGTLVEEVNVRVGDPVKKGDVLATFDTTSLDSMLEKKRRDFESARGSYEEYLKNVEEAPQRAAALKARIAELEETLSDIQNNTGKASKTPENSALAGLRDSVAAILGNGRLATWIVNTVFKETGTIAQTFKLFENLLSGSLFSGFSGDSIGAMLGSISSLSNPEMLSTSLELVQLKVQESMMSLQQGTSLESIYKALSDSSESAYKQAEEIITHLKTGWTASCDGIIREVNITAGEAYYTKKDNNPVSSSINVTSLLASLSAGQADIATLLSGLFSGTVSGMVVEYYPFTASFMLGKYDISKLSLDQKVKVTSITGQEFEAIVTYISPVASESDFNIGSILGGSGSSRGVEARITIPQPDESITIGLDVDVFIDLETRKDVLQVPAGAILYDEEENKNYVFLFHNNKTIEKRFVKTGLFDGMSYEVIEGLEEKQDIVRTPAKEWESGQKIRVSG